MFYKHFLLDFVELIRCFDYCVLFQSITVPWYKMATSLPVFAILVANITSDWGTYTLLTSIPSYMKEVLKLNISEVSTATPLSDKLWFFFNICLSGKISHLTYLKKSKCTALSFLTAFDSCTITFSQHPLVKHRSICERDIKRLSVLAVPKYFVLFPVEKIPICQLIIHGLMTDVFRVDWVVTWYSVHNKSCCLFRTGYIQLCHTWYSGLW